MIFTATNKKVVVKKRYDKKGYEVFYCGYCRKQLLKIKEQISSIRMRSSCPKCNSILDWSIIL